MGQLLTTASVLMCPHGGSVSASTSNTQSSAGAPLVRATDTFSIIGCAFMLGTSPHPCVLVNWVVAAARCKAGGDALLTTDSVGLCVAADQAPQGSVLIQSTQTKASGR